MGFFSSIFNQNKSRQHFDEYLDSLGNKSKHINTNLKCAICSLEITGYTTVNKEHVIREHTFYYKKWFIFEKKLYICLTCQVSLNDYGDALFWKENNYNTGKDYITDTDIKNKILNNKEEFNKELEQRRNAKKGQEQKRANKKINFENEIINLLKTKGKKMTSSDIAGFLDYRNVDKLKDILEEMHHSSKINRTGNYRYFV